jgi:hypothetical protein
MKLALTLSLGFLERSYKRYKWCIFCKRKLIFKNISKGAFGKADEILRKRNLYNGPEIPDSSGTGPCLSLCQHIITVVGVHCGI